MTNEAAERLADGAPTAEAPESGDLIIGNALMAYYGWDSKRATAFTDAVHAAERRATVERIRAEIARSAAPGAHSAAVNGFRDVLAVILDEEAAR